MRVSLHQIWKSWAISIGLNLGSALLLRQCHHSWFFTGVLFQLLFFPWTHSGWSGGLPLHLGGHCVWGCDVTIWFEIFFMFWDVVLWSVICAAMFCVVLLRPSLESVEVGLPRCIVPLRPPAGATRQRSPPTSVSLTNATRVVTLAWLLYWK